jgi:hypothetical protein
LAEYCEIIELATNVSNSDIRDVWYSHSSFIVSSPLDFYGAEANKHLQRFREGILSLSSGILRLLVPINGG